MGMLKKTAAELIEVVRVLAGHHGPAAPFGVLVCREQNRVRRADSLAPARSSRSCGALAQLRSDLLRQIHVYY